MHLSALVHVLGSDLTTVGPSPPPYGCELRVKGCSDSSVFSRRWIAYTSTERQHHFCKMSRAEAVGGAPVRHGSLALLTSARACTFFSIQRGRFLVDSFMTGLKIAWIVACFFGPRTGRSAPSSIGFFMLAVQPEAERAAEKPGRSHKTSRDTMNCSGTREGSSWHLCRKQNSSVWDP